MEFQDYYKTLGIDKTASQEEIKKVYRKLAKQYHPDSNSSPDAEIKFKKISEAYNVLSDPEKRNKYDRLGANWNKHRETGGGNDDFNWSDYVAQNAQKYSGNARQKVGDMFGDAGGISDFFEKIFGGGFSGSTRTKQNSQRAKGENFKAEVEITLEESFKGVKKILNINGEKLEINLKPGVNSGQTLKISGKGQNPNDGSSNGDLLITVKVKDDSRFKRMGNDLYLDFEVDYLTAALGGSEYVKTLGGKVKVNIPANSRSGKILKLKGMGMTDYKKQDIKGDLFLKLVIQLPEKLSAKEIELFNQIKTLKQN